MIGSVDWFGQTFGSVPEGEIEWNARVAKAMINDGLAVVIIRPQDKLPACVLNATDAKRANTEAQNRAKEKGNPGWDKVIHPCGVTHALTDVKYLTRVQVKKLLAEGANLAIALGKGTRRVAVGDIDTAEQLESFRALYASHGETAPGLTVVSPGVRRVSENGEAKWIHKNGGHVWFDVPDGVELPDTKGKFSWCPCHEFRPSIVDPSNANRRIPCPRAFALYWGTGYVLVPPSVRPEGAYRLTGEAVSLPLWLSAMAGQSVPSQGDGGSDGFLGGFEEDPIDAWAESITWEEILTADGFVPSGADTCGCPTYTRPGDATHSKSVTGHEDTCSYFDGSSGQAPCHIWSDSVLGGEATLSKLNWITEYRFNGDRREAMASLGLVALHDSREDVSIFDAILRKGSGDDSGKGEVPEEYSEEGSDDASDDGDSELSDHEFLTMSHVDESGTSTEVQTYESALDEWLAEQENEIKREARKIVIREKARELATELLIGQTWTAPDFEDDLSELFELPRDEENFAIDRLLPVGGNLMLSAEYKSGKTTVMLEFIRALADGVPFLGKFAVKSVGRVGVWNLELSARMMTDWLRDTAMDNPSNVRLLNLRGKRIPLETKAGQAWAVQWLQSREVHTWVVDPAVRAMIGFGDENDNGAVTVFTDVLDTLKERAGVSELIIAHHTGRAEMEAGRERARGATRWDDWPDVRGILTKDHESGTRFIRFAGRIDEEIPERALMYDADRRRVSVAGSGDPWEELDRKQAQLQRLCEKVLEQVIANPGISQSAIMTATALHDREVKKAVKALESKGLVIVNMDGPRGSKQHFPGTEALTTLPTLPTGESESGRVGEIMA